MGGGGNGCALCHSASALFNLAGSVFSNHHLRMANSSSRSQADLPKRISPFLRATGSAPEIRAAQCCCFLVATAQSAQMLRQQQSKKLDGIRSPQRNVANVTLSLTAYFTSSLLTRFSTWFSLVNISRLVSFISVCNVSRLVAICSTALVSLITAAAASSLRREKPNSPIAATLMDAPAIAANTSITAQAGVAFSLAQSPNPAEVLPLLKDTTPSSVTGPGTGLQLL